MKTEGETGVRRRWTSASGEGPVFILCYPEAEGRMREVSTEKGLGKPWNEGRR